MLRKWQPLSMTLSNIVAPIFADIKRLIPVLLYVLLNTNHSSGATLTVNLSGTGQGSVNSSPAGIACPGSCIGSFSTVTLFPNPGYNSLFKGWGGACLGMESCSLTTISDTTVNAYFEVKSSPYKVRGSHYGALQGAYNSVAQNGQILTVAMDQAGDLTLDKAINVTLAGGYDSLFTGNDVNITKLGGKISIMNGCLTINNIVLTSTPPEPPPAPSGIIATPGDSQIKLDWAPTLGATSYNIYYSTSSGVTRADGTKITSATPGQEITGLTNGISYFVVVTAENANGEGVESVQVIVSPGPSLAHGYFKTAVGSQSVFVSGRVDTITSNNNSRLILQVDKDGLSTLYALTVTGNAIAIEAMRKYDVSGNITGEWVFTPALRIFPAATAVNTIESQTVITTSADSSTSTDSCTLTVLAQEPVTLTSGITYQNTLKIQNSCTADISWFAPGVGPVKVLSLTDNTVDELGTPPGYIPAELVGTWNTSYSYYTFNADGTFYYGSLSWPPAPCILYSQIQNYKYGTANVSGNSITLNTAGGQVDRWNCYVPRDGSPNSTTPVIPSQSTETWTISGNVLTLDDGKGGMYSAINYTKE